LLTSSASPAVAVAEPLLAESVVTLKCAPDRTGIPARNAHGTPTLSTNLFTTDATGATRPASTDEILDAARAILAHRVRRGQRSASG